MQLYSFSLYFMVHALSKCLKIKQNENYPHRDTEPIRRVQIKRIKRQKHDGERSKCQRMFLVFDCRLLLHCHGIELFATAQQHNGGIWNSYSFVIIDSPIELWKPIIDCNVWMNCRYIWFSFDKPKNRKSGNKVEKIGK